MLTLEQLLKSHPFDDEKLRLGFVLYGSWNEVDWLTVTPENVKTTSKDVLEQLAPLLPARLRPDARMAKAWTDELVSEARVLVKRVLPLNDKEREFIERVKTKAELVPELVTSDPRIQGVIRDHAHLRWKLQNIEKHVLKK